MALGAAAVCGESRMHGDNGGDEETGREVPRLVPTHCGRGGQRCVAALWYRRRSGVVSPPPLSAGVRWQYLIGRIGVFRYN
jgi:hypothetical protein